MALVRSKQSLGIFPTDVVVRTAITAALADMRDQTWLLDFALQAFLHDPLTIQEYGAAELERCKNWFLDNDIKVSMGYKINQAKQPHVVIWHGDTSESDSTTGDTNDSPRETIPWVVGTAPLFRLKDAVHNPATGWITVTQNTKSIFPGMKILDRSRGQAYEITETDGQRFRIALGQELHLPSSDVYDANRLWIAHLESRAYREALRIECVASGEGLECLMLWTIIIFALNKYNQEYLEGRGFDRMTISSGGMEIAQDGQNANQIMYRRVINLNGITKQYWPKQIQPSMRGIRQGTALDQDQDALSGVVTDLDTIDDSEPDTL